MEKEGLREKVIPTLGCKELIEMSVFKRWGIRGTLGKKNWHFSRGWDLGNSKLVDVSRVRGKVFRRTVGDRQVGGMTHLVVLKPLE